MSVIAAINSGVPPVLLDEFREVLERWPRVQAVWLFGSRANGNFRSRSDIDFAIEGQSLSFADFLALKAQLEDLNSPRTVDLLLPHQIDHPALLEHGRRVGVPFYVQKAGS